MPDSQQLGHPPEALTAACRSIIRAIALPGAGDIVVVRLGRFGDLNRNGVLGGIAGEETGLT